MGHETTDEKKKKLIAKHKECWNESKDSSQDMINEFTEDHKFYLSDQWWDKGKDIAAVLRAKNVPALNLNLTKKAVDVISGVQRQNKTDLKFWPEEGGDQDVAQVLTRVGKWVRNTSSSRFEEVDAKKSSLICGLGWLHMRMDFTKDPVNGDVVIEKISPFNMLYSPQSTKKDLSDSNYLIHHQLSQKTELISLFPDYTEAIEGKSGQTENNGVYQDAQVNSDKGNYLKVEEYWYKELTSVTQIVNTADPSKTYIWGPGEAQSIRDKSDDKKIKKMTDDQLMEKVLKEENTQPIKMKYPLIKRAIIIDDDLVVDDKYHTDSDCFPYVPFWAFYETSYSEMDKKIQGIIRVLKDPQREKNKRRSNFLEAVGSVVASGFMAEENAIKDTNKYRTAAKSGQILTYRRGYKEPKQITPPDVPQSFMLLEQMSENDMFKMSVNPELLGNLTQAGEPGISIQLRQKQGLAAFQEIFDNHALAATIEGKIIGQMIIRNFTVEKMKRILGDDGLFSDKFKAIEQQMQQIATQSQQLKIQAVNDPKIADRVDQLVEEMNIKLNELSMQADDLQKKENGFWGRFKGLSRTFKYDVVVDEISNSPTARMATMEQLRQMQQYGKEIPIEMFIEYSDMDLTIKEKFLAIEASSKQAKQQQAQAAQQESQRLSQQDTQKFQLEMAKITQKTEQQSLEHQQKMAEIQLDMTQTQLEIAKTVTPAAPA